MKKRKKKGLQEKEDRILQKEREKEKQTR